MEDFPDINSWKDLIKIVNENKDDVLLFIVTILAVYSMFLRRVALREKKSIVLSFRVYITELVSEKNCLKSNISEPRMRC